MYCCLGVIGNLPVLSFRFEDVLCFPAIKHENSQENEGWLMIPVGCSLANFFKIFFYLSVPEKMKPSHTFNKCKAFSLFDTYNS